MTTYEFKDLILLNDGYNQHKTIAIKHSIETDGDLVKLQTIMPIGIKWTRKEDLQNAIDIMTLRHSAAIRVALNFRIRKRLPLITALAHKLGLKGSSDFFED